MIRFVEMGCPKRKNAKIVALIGSNSSFNHTKQLSIKLIKSFILFPKT